MSVPMHALANEVFASIALAHATDILYVIIIDERKILSINLLGEYAKAWKSVNIFEPGSEQIIMNPSDISFYHDTGDDSSKKNMKKMSEYKHIIHNIAPVYDERSVILILGSFPSVKSRDAGFFYGNPQNRFWKVLSGIFNDSVPDSIPERKKYLLRHRIAVWDVVQSCDIEGSKDSSIKNAKPSDINNILKVSDIRLIITNGRTSDRLYRSLIEPVTGIKALCLPSTSPANAAWSLGKLTEKWREAIMPYEDMTIDSDKSINRYEKTFSNSGVSLYPAESNSEDKSARDLTPRIIEKIKKLYSPKLERPWYEYPDFITVKDPLSGKWFALFMIIDRKIIGLKGDGRVPVVNVKSDPELIHMINHTEGFSPAYHMNKEHWITIRLDGSVEEEKILSLIDQSMKMITDTPARRIYEAVKKIPRGRVATYSRVAGLAGNPRMSRAVGNALHKNPDPLTIPCYRVVNSKGELSENFAFGGREAQKRLLEADGVEVLDYKVDLAKYGF